MPPHPHQLLVAGSRGRLRNAVGRRGQFRLKARKKQGPSPGSPGTGPARYGRPGYPRLTPKMCIAVTLDPTWLLTFGKVIEATVFDESTGTEVANTYMVMPCDVPLVLLRYGMVATVTSPLPGVCAQSVNDTVWVDEVPSV